MAEKKKGLLSRFGLKSKDDKRAEEAAQKAEAQKRVDQQMAERMAAINAAALKSAREMDALTTPQGASETSAEEIARIEAEEKRKAEIQAAKDVARAKQLAEEREREATIKIEAEAIALKADTEEAGEYGEAKSKAEAEAIKEDTAKVAEKARLKRLTDEAKEAKRRARIAEEKATREANERDALEKLAAERKAKLEAEGKLTPKSDPEDTASNFLARISTGLRKSTSRMSESMSASFTKRTLDAEAIEELEDILIASDLGTGPAMKVTAKLSEDKFDKQITDLEIKIALADVISDILTPLEKPIVLGAIKPQIMLFVGVNGSGKTTTLGKIAKRFTDDGKKVLIAAGDTFRAAAFEQLSVWGERANAPVMSGKLGADAAGLVYDAIDRARNEDFDILMIDTAGRLQNRTELMDELAKVLRVIKKQDETAPHHSILVLDATVGQNALMQTEAFAKTAEVSGLIMTKLDGTAKGGVLVALSDKYKLPIHYIGIGEQIEDLENFSAPVFAAALSGVADEMSE